MFFQKDIETAPRAEIEAIQLAKLQKLVKYCYDNVPFYNKRLTEAGVTPDKIKTLSDIQYIPFTTKDDIRDNYPFGMFATPMKDIVRIHASSGTTGKPTVVGYTKDDLDMWSDCVARLLVAAGATDEDIVQIAFGYGLFTGALGLHYGLEKIGATVIPISSGNTEKQIMIMKDFGTTGLVSTPSYALHIGEVAERMGVGQLKLNKGFFGSEGCTNEMRDQIEQRLHIFATDNYGMSELCGPGVAGECHLRNGLHFSEDHFLPEIIDSKTGQVLPHGSTGELVVTTLSKQGIPMLRYRTKDITRINYEKCECGRTHARMDKVKGRTDDMLKIRGVNVFPSQIESIIMTMPQIAPCYQLIVDTDKNGILDTLELKVELADSSLLDRYSELEDLRKQINHRLKTILGISCKISLVEYQSIERTAGKAARIIDNRKNGRVI